MTQEEKKIAFLRKQGITIVALLVMVAVAGWLWVGKVNNKEVNASLSLIQNVACAEENHFSRVGEKMNKEDLLLYHNGEIASYQLGGALNQDIYNWSKSIDNYKNTMYKSPDGGFSIVARNKSNSIDAIYINNKEYTTARGLSINNTITQFNDVYGGAFKFNAGSDVMYSVSWGMYSIYCMADNNGNINKLYISVD